MANKNSIKKIAVKTVYGKVTFATKQVEINGETHNILADNETVEKPIMRVLGRCHGIKRGESTYGPFVELAGQFEATNLKTGEVYGAGKAFVPLIDEDVVGALSVEGVTSVDFAVEVVARFTGKGAMGYEYAVKNLVNVGRAADPFATLRQEAGLTALPAPEKTGGEEVAPTEGKKTAAKK